MVNKKAISPVITTVLLVMISLAAVAIVAYFVFPFMDRIQERRACFQAIDQIEIDTSSKYTCYYLIDPTPTDTANGDEYAIVNVSVKRGAESLGIEQFVLSIYGEGRSEKVEVIKDMTNTAKISMYGESGTHLIEVPQRREMMTYSLTTDLGEVTSMELSPMVGGNTACDAADRKTIEKC